MVSTTTEEMHPIRLLRKNKKKIKIKIKKNLFQPHGATLDNNLIFCLLGLPLAITYRIIKKIY